MLISSSGVGCHNEVRNKSHTRTSTYRSLTLFNPSLSVCALLFSFFIIMSCFPSVPRSLFSLHHLLFPHLICSSSFFSVSPFSFLHRADPSLGLAKSMGKQEQSSASWDTTFELKVLWGVNRFFDFNIYSRSHAGRDSFYKHLFSIQNNLIDEYNVKKIGIIWFFTDFFHLNALNYPSPGGLGLDASALLKYWLLVISLLIWCLEMVYKNVDDERLSEKTFWVS